MSLQHAESNTRSTDHPGVGSLVDPSRKPLSIVVPYIRYCVTMELRIGRLPARRECLIPWAKIIVTKAYESAYESESPRTDKHLTIILLFIASIIS
jgi:hypothetical protein